MPTNKLGRKLTWGLVAVAVAAIIVSYLLVNYTIDLRFKGYLDRRQQVLYSRIQESLGVSYEQNGRWSKSLHEAMPHFAMMNRVFVKVYDRGGNLVAQTPSTMMTDGDMADHMAKVMGFEGPMEPDVKQRVEMPIVVEGRKVGTVEVTPVGQASQLVEDENFRRSINTSLALGGLLAVLIALALSYIISTRLTLPLAQMTRAAKKMAAGDLRQRVAVDSADEIGELGQAFNHLAIGLERQEKLRKHLTADVAHELRTPLATVRSHVEGLMDGIIKTDVEQLRSIHEEIMRLGRLVDDLGELAQVESGRAAVDFTQFDISALVEQAALGMEPLFREKGVDLLTDVNRPIIGRFDKDKIKQVVVNLLANALKYTPQGGRVSLSVVKPEDKVVITVSDTGVGIDEESLPYIFERFYRVDKSRNRATGGSGIGLTIAKEVARMHGGDINVSSTLGSGTTFEVLLPVD